MKPVIHSIIFLTLTLIVFHGCSVDADRDNPLDPKGDIYNPPASLTGKITRINTDDPIPEVNLLLSPGSFASYTDENGDYIIAADIAGVFDLLITHPQYKDIETQISLVWGAGITANYKMDAATIIDSVSVTSQRIEIDDNEETFEYLINVHVEISDSDGSSDLDSSTVECSFLDQLIVIENIGGSDYNLSLSEDMFPGNDIENMIGVEFDIRLIDKIGDTLCAPLQEIRTIFDFRIDPGSPDTRDGSGYLQHGNPTFDWEVPNHAIVLEHYYRIKVFRDNDQLRYEKLLSEGMENFTLDDSIGFDATYDLLDDTLSIGYYYWTLQMEDSFGNFTRSAEIPFEIQ
ncbi:MAG: hypothetical protein H8E46_07485 [FCB group bacterium]|nr:hypothetical protein [FCB group bacterium]